MKNKMVLIFIVIFMISFSSCNLIKDDENKELSENIVENNIASDENLVGTNEEKIIKNEVINDGFIKNSNEKDDKNIILDENNYIKFEKLSMDKIVAYDCNNFKTSEYIQRCTNYKNIMGNYYNMMKNVQTKEVKIKMLKEWNITFCEEYLKTKDEEWYFNCSLAIIVANGKVKCSDIKNVGNFTKYFGKTCDEVVVEMNKYIEELKMKQKYEKMLKWFWWEGWNMWNVDLNEVYLNEVLK